MKSLIKNIGISKIFLIIEILFVLFLSLLNLAVSGLNGHWAWINLVGSDGASDVITAISHNFGLGIPYKDYWDYRPPGFVMLVDYWIRIFGFKIFSFKLLELLIRFGIGLEICLLARKIFSPLQAFIVSVLTCFVFFSPPFGTMMLAEPYGLFFSLLGLLILLYVKNFNRRYFFASFFLFLSGQMKDPFVFTLLAFIPLLFNLLVIRNFRSLFKSLFLILGGLLGGFLILWLYLLNLGSLNAYIETFLFKSTNFHARIWEDLGFFIRRFSKAFGQAKDAILIFRYSSIAILFFWFSTLIYSLLPKRPYLFRVKTKDANPVFIFPSLNFSLTTEKLNSLVVIFFSIGIFAGFSLNNGFTPRYLVMIVVPLYFIWFIVISSFVNNLQIIFNISKKNVVFLFLTLLLLSPKFWIITPYGEISLPNLFSQAYRNLTLPDDAIPVEKYINSKTSINDCLISLYGWKSPEVPLYSMRQPCSRFVQANLVNAPWQQVEYREAIYAKPPAAIIYSLEGADMDVAKFESEVVNFTKIIKNCYKQDKKYIHNGRWSLELYFPIVSGEQLKTCVKNNNEII